MTLNYNDISSIDLRDYAKSLGWQQMERALRDGLIVLTNQAFARRQLIFPIDSNVPDYADSIKVTLDKLSEIENKPLGIIIDQLNELNDDTIRFRVVDSRNEENFIPLNYAVSALNGARELLLSAASTVLKPQVRHPRMSRVEAQELLDKSRFRQTEKGSFVIKISSPIRAVETQANLFDGEHLPFVRQTTLNIHDNLDRLVTAIQTDHLNTLVEETKQSPTPALSANFCKALSNFQETHNDYDLYVDFTWANAYPVDAAAVKKVIKIQRDYFPRIYDVSQELKSDTPEKEEDTFMATVEHLAGQLDADGRRAGEVILNLYREDEVIRARTILTADQYVDADTAHMTSGTYIKVAGKLLPGYQPRNMVDISSFEIVK